MSQVLIVYDTHDGQCEKIADGMADTIEVLGHQADIVNVEDVSDQIIKSHADALIIGGPIKAGGHSKALRKFVERYRTKIHSIPSAFFSVSLSAAGGQEHRDDATRCMNRFLDETDFHPDETAILAGALKYQSYGFFKRVLMKQIVRRAGGDTDTSRDYEYTNWPEVSLFVERFLSRAGIEAFPVNSS